MLNGTPPEFTVSRLVYKIIKIISKSISVVCSILEKYETFGQVQQGCKGLLRPLNYNLHCILK